MIFPFIHDADNQCSMFIELVLEVTVTPAISFYLDFWMKKNFSQSENILPSTSSWYKSSLGFFV